MRILLVEPNLDIAQAIEMMLKSERMQVYTTDLAEEAIDLGKLYDYDAIVTEIALPDISGFEVVRALRVAKVPTPVLVLTHANVVEDKVRALSLGADDYMTKPFHKDELVARIHAVARRGRGLPDSNVIVGNVRIELGTKTVLVAGERIHLTNKEFLMLELLSLRKEAICTKEAFLNHLYGGRDEPDLKIIDVFICKLRQKLNRAGATAVVETIWGRGYTLAEPRRVANLEAVAA